MRKRIAHHGIIFLLVTISFFGVSFEFVNADAWWGDGYRSPEWVRSNGGTTISYTVEGTSHTDRYKAMMFRGGNYVEVEFGKHAIFDDAKNGTYLINFYKCKDCLKHKFDKKTKIRDKDKLVASITIVARPGEANTLVFDASNNTVRLVGRSGARKRIDSFIAQKKSAVENTDLVCELAQAKTQRNRLEQFLVLTDAVDRDKFRDKNVKVGIIPQFLVKNNIKQYE